MLFVRSFACCSVNCHLRNRKNKVEIDLSLTNLCHACLQIPVDVVWYPFLSMFKSNRFIKKKLSTCCNLGAAFHRAPIKMYSENIQQIYRRTILKCDFEKVAAYWKYQQLY